MTNKTESLYEIVSINHPIFKLVGVENSIKEYNSNLSCSNNDWSSLYCQYTKEHALEALGYRWEKGYKSANLIEFCLNESAKFVKFHSNSMFYDINIPQDLKADYIKKILSMDITSKLIYSLKYDGLIIEEREKEYEIVIPHSKVNDLIVSEKIINTYNTPMCGLPVYL